MATLQRTFSLLVVLILLSSLGGGGVLGDNILFFTGVGTHSTRKALMPLMEALADNGHNVTFLSPFPYQNKELELRDSKVQRYEHHKLMTNMGDWDKLFDFYQMRSKGEAQDLWYEFTDTGVDSCEVILSDPEFVRWMKSVKCDLVILEAVSNECVFGPAYLWNAKLIMYSTLPVIPHHEDSFGLPDESSSIPDVMFGFEGGPKMTFYKRFRNALNPVLFALQKEYQYFPKLEEINKEAFGEDVKDKPSLREMDKNVSIVLMTQHYSLDKPRSFPPNVVPVGGNVVAGKKKVPLLKGMEDFIKSGEKGFMFVSFGTVAEFTSFDKGVQLQFIQALAQFPERKFVWNSRHPITMTDKLPHNVFVTSWAPQQTLLGHPEIRGFVTHSGMGSTVEAVHFGVPLVCIPVLADQDEMARVIVDRGAGVKVEIVGLREEELAGAIREILTNDKYYQTIKGVQGSTSDTFGERRLVGGICPPS